MPKRLYDKRPVCSVVFEALKKRDPQGKMVVSEDVLKRFAQKVMVAENGCWEWIGANDRSFGYGILTVNKNRIRTHRLSWKFFHGEIKNGLCICHHCDNPLCVNPDHLFSGTQLDNIKDMELKNRRVSVLGMIQRRKTHCPKGHPYSGKNLVLRFIKNMQVRRCRICLKIRAHIYWKKHGWKYADKRK